jgi:hypothetical protein
MAGKNPLAAIRILCPEFGDEDSDALDTESSIIAERRAKAHRLRCQGKKLAEIAAELKCGIGTVHRDLAHVRESFKLVALQDAADHRAQLLDELAFAKREAVEAWMASKGEATETSTSRRSAAAGDFSMASVKRKQRDGDPRFLKMFVETLRLHGQIVNVISQDDVKDKDAPTPVKIVAGIDPVEVV